MQIRTAGTGQSILWYRISGLRSKIPRRAGAVNHARHKTRLCGTIAGPPELTAIRTRGAGRACVQRGTEAGAARAFRRKSPQRNPKNTGPAPAAESAGRPVRQPLPPCGLIRGTVAVTAGNGPASLPCTPGSRLRGYRYFVNGFTNSGIYVYPLPAGRKPRGPATDW